MDSLQPQHTNRQYEEDLRALRSSLLKMGGLVERQIAEAMEALVNRDTPKARETIARDAEVNRLDVETDELMSWPACCLREQRPAACLELAEPPHGPPRARRSSSASCASEPSRTSGRMRNARAPR
jgi:hypothetical protein